jgi:hypothetical protein
MDHITTITTISMYLVKMFFLLHFDVGDLKSVSGLP